MLTFYAAGKKGLSSSDLGACAEHVKQSLWIDLFQPTHEEELAVEAALGLGVPTREEMQEIELSRRFYREKDALFMTTTVLTRSDAQIPESSAVTFILTAEHVVTLRYADPVPFRTFTANWNAAPDTYKSSGDVMAGIVDAIVERLADILEATGAGLDKLSLEVLGVAAKDTSKVAPPARDFNELLRRIGRHSDLASRARESVGSMNRLIIFVREAQREDKKWKTILHHLETVTADLNFLADYASFLSGKVSFLLDATLGLISNEQNAIIKLLSVGAVVIGPPTLIAGVYGMNFQHMPEYAWRLGYPWALLLMAASAVLPLLWFKKRGWL